MNNFQRNIYRLYTEVITPIITCNATAVSGGQGVTEYTIQLDKPLGGIVIMDFNAQTVVDKLEIIHNGVKKATSGMTTANAGPFDDLYGNPTVPTGAQASATDQFIGTSKGAIPTRDSIFLSETGITDIVRTRQQLIWWVYTQTDYELLNNVIVRVTGISGTAWDLQRLCTDQVPTGVTPPTEITSYQFTSACDSGVGGGTACCIINTYPQTFHCSDFPIILGSMFYSDFIGGTEVVGANLWYKEQLSQISYRIANFGEVIAINTSCM